MIEDISRWISILLKPILDSSNEMKPKEKTIEARVNQPKNFLRLNGFNQSLRNILNNIKEDSKFDLL